MPQTVVAKSLDGRSYSVEVEDTGTVGALKQQLLQLAGCKGAKLLLGGRCLDNTEPLSSLNLQPQDTLVLLPLGPGKRKPGRGQAGAGTTADWVQQLGVSEQGSSAVSRGEPDTLLPGYVSRPNPSPVKPKRGGLAGAAPAPAPALAPAAVAVAVAAETAAAVPAAGDAVAPQAWAALAQQDPMVDAVFAELASELAAAPVQLEASGSLLHQAHGSHQLGGGQGISEPDSLSTQPAAKRRRSSKKGGQAAPDTKAQQQQPLSPGELRCALPLPSSLERLVERFQLLVDVYSLLLKHKVQATLRTCRQALQGHSKESEGDRPVLQLAALELMAALCPQLLLLRDRSRLDEDDWGSVSSSSSSLRAGPPALAAGGEPQPVGSAAEHDRSGGFLESVPLQQGWSFEAASKAAEAALRGSAAASSLDGAGTVEAGDKEGYVIEILDPGRRSQRPASSVALAETLDIADPVQQCCSDAEQQSGGMIAGLEGMPGRNACERRKNAFRCCLASAVMVLHDRWLQQRPQEAAAAAAASGAAVEEGDWAWDTAAEGRWHPQFPLEEYGVAEVLALAAEAPTSPHEPRALPRPPRLSKKHAGCRSTQGLDSTALLAHLQQQAWYQGQVAHTQHIPARDATYAQTRHPLSPAVQAALSAAGIRQLFAHQAAAIDAVLSGQHTVVCTATASGKSLCYNVPLLQALSTCPGACCLYMSPTKALAQDQRRAMQALCIAALGDHAPHIEVYDGDTPQSERPGIRASAQILFTNPDMLHCSILPAHREFARLLANLKLVVVDEGHAYRGVFGAHTACVLRRLQRLCHLVYGSSPVLVMTSATIGNPKAHAQALLGVKDVTLVDRDTSPCGPKAFVLWNPPLTAMSQAMSRRAAATAQQGQAQQEVAPAEVEALRADALARKQQAAAVDAVCRAAAHVDGERAECVKQPPQGATPARTDEAAMGSCCPHDVAVGAAASDGASVEPAAAASAPAPSAAEMRRLTELRRASERKISAIINRSTVDPRGPGPQAASPGQRPLVRFNASRLHGELAAQGDTPQLAQAIAQVSTRLQAKAAALGDWKEAKALISSDGEARRVSPMVEISQVLAECVQHGARTIAFCKTRKLSELVTVYTREILQGVDPGLAAKVKVYRGGYAPEDRRRLEAALHSGALLAVCATNALELGVDIGGLDVTLHLGFPGTLASLRQQAGRAGRREQPSLAVYVAFDGPLDQYFIHNPEQLFAKPVEHAQVDPSNAHILQQHLMCAAAELPIHLDVDAQYFGPGLLPAAQALVARSLMGRHPRALGGASGGLHYTGPRDSPAATISLRAIDPHRFTIINEADGSVKEEIEASMAFFEVYDGAIYMHQGRTYLCKRLDVQAQQAIVRPVDVKYYTVVVDITDVHVCGGRLAYPLAPPAAAGEGLSVMFGEAVVSVCFQGFSRVWQGSNIPFDYVDLWLPNACYDTQATWVDVPAAARLECQAAGLSVREGCHGAGHAVLNVLPLLLMAGPSDMATDCDHPHDTRRREERVLLYDKHPGGIGLALQAAALLPDMLQRAHKLVIDCPCTSASGCPCCVQHAACKHYNVAMSKPATEVVLRHLLLVQGQQLTAAVQPSAAAGATQ